MGRPAALSDYSDEENAFWACLEEKQSLVFYTARGLKFQYRIVGGEMFVSGKTKSITRSTVMMAYRRARELQTVTGPKQLGVFGASYLYPVFLTMGVCTREQAAGGDRMSDEFRMERL